MKTYIYMLLFALVNGFWGCYDDESTYDTATLPDVKIDVENVSKNIDVSYLGNLKLDIPVSKDGIADHADLGYEWKIELSSTDKVVEVLSNERVLDVTATMPIQANAYTLLLTVTDSATDLRYLASFSVFVSSEFRDGLVVAHSRDGQTSDLTLIMDEHLTLGHTGEEKVVSDIYASKGAAFPDKIKTMTYTISGSTYGNYTNILWVTGEQGIYRIDIKDYAYTDTKSIVPMESESLVAEGFYPSSQTTLMVANQKVYMHLRQNDQIFIKPERPMNDQGVESNHADNGVIAVAIGDNMGNSGNAVWYDSKQECFGRFNSYYASPKFALFSQSEYNEAFPFNPARVPNKTAVAGGMMGGEVLTMLLKDKSSQDYEFYLFKYVPTEYSTYLTPYMKYTVPSALKSVLDAAVSFSFSTVDPILYVATKTDVYAVRMNLTELSYESTYTVVNGEEISLIKVFQEGWYSMCPDDYMNGWREEVLPLHTKALLIATQSGNNGKVYLVPSKDSGTGNLDKANQIVYEGFGVISDMIMQGK